MGTVPKTAPAGDGDPASRARAESLRAEFPGWTISAAPWSATRDTGRDDSRGGALCLAASSYGELRALLDEVDAVDCRNAITALGEALKARGLKVEVFGLSLHTQTRTGILRVVAARHGMYAWTSGVDIGPIGDPDGAAEKMLPGLGLA